MEQITKYTLTTINSRWEATQRVMAAKLTRLTHRIALQLHSVAESCIICSSRSRRPVLKLWVHSRMCCKYDGEVAYTELNYEFFISFSKALAIDVLII